MPRRQRLGPRASMGRLPSTQRSDPKGVLPLAGADSTSLLRCLVLLSISSFFLLSPIFSSFAIHSTQSSSTYRPAALHPHFLFPYHPSITKRSTTTLLNFSFPYDEIDTFLLDLSFREPNPRTPNIKLGHIPVDLLELLPPHTTFARPRSKDEDRDE